MNGFDLNLKSTILKTTEGAYLFSEPPTKNFEIQISNCITNDSYYQTFESQHPYHEGSRQVFEINIPDAQKVAIFFDERSSTDTDCDKVFFKPTLESTEILGEEYCGGYNGSTSNFPTLANPLIVDNHNLICVFESNSSNCDWGFKFVAVDAACLNVCPKSFVAEPGFVVTPLQRTLYEGKNYVQVAAGVRVSTLSNKSEIGEELLENADDADDRYYEMTETTSGDNDIVMSPLQNQISEPRITTRSRSSTKQFLDNPLSAKKQSKAVDLTALVAEVSATVAISCVVDDMTTVPMWMLEENVKLIAPQISVYNVSSNIPFNSTNEYSGLSICFHPETVLCEEDSITIFKSKEMDENSIIAHYSWENFKDCASCLPTVKKPQVVRCGETIWLKHKASSPFSWGFAMAACPVVVPEDVFDVYTKVSNSNGKFKIFETPHPYTDSENIQFECEIEGASRLLVYFDPKSSTEQNFDYLLIDNIKYSGGRGGTDKNFPVAPAPPIIIEGSKFQATFVGDGSNNDWGVRFIVLDSGIFNNDGQGGAGNEDQSGDNSKEVFRKNSMDIFTYFHNTSNKVQTVMIDMPVQQLGYFEIHFFTDSTCESFVQVGAIVNPIAVKSDIKHGDLENLNEICLGVGSSNSSYSIDGIIDSLSTSIKWTSNVSIPNSSKLVFTAGTILGVLCDVSGGKIQYYLQNDGAAFQPQFVSWSSGLCPAFSFLPGQRLFVNVGQNPFKYLNNVKSILLSYSPTSENGICRIWDESWKVWKNITSSDNVLDDYAAPTIIKYCRYIKVTLDDLVARELYKESIKDTSLQKKEFSNKKVRKRDSFISYDRILKYETFLRFSSIAVPLFGDIILHDLSARRLIVSGVQYHDHRADDEINIDTLRVIAETSFFGTEKKIKLLTWLNRPPDEIPFPCSMRLRDLAIIELIQSLGLDKIFLEQANLVYFRLSKSKKKKLNRPKFFAKPLSKLASVETKEVNEISETEFSNPTNSPLHPDLNGPSGRRQTKYLGTEFDSELLLIDDEKLKIIEKDEIENGSVSSASCENNDEHPTSKMFFLNLVKCIVSSKDESSGRALESALLASRLLRTIAHSVPREIFRNHGASVAPSVKSDEVVNLNEYESPSELFTLVVVQTTLLELGAAELACFMIGQGGEMLDEGIELAIYLMRFMNKAIQDEFMRVINDDVDGVMLRSLTKYLLGFSDIINGTWGPERLKHLESGKNVLKFLQNLSDGQNKIAQDKIAQCEIEGRSLVVIVVDVMESIFYLLNYLGTEAIKINAIEIRYLMDVAQQAMDSLSDFSQGPHNAIQLLLVTDSSILSVLGLFLQTSIEFRYAALKSLSDDSILPPLANCIPSFVNRLDVVKKQLTFEEQWEMCSMLTEVEVSALDLINALTEQAKLESKSETLTAQVTKFSKVIDNLDVKACILRFKELWATVVFDSNIHVSKYLAKRDKIIKLRESHEEDEDEQHNEGVLKQLKKAVSIVADNSVASSFKPTALGHLEIDNLDLLIRSAAVRSRKEEAADLQLAFAYFRNITLLCDNIADDDFISACSNETRLRLQNFVTMWTPSIGTGAIVTVDEASGFGTYFAKIEVTIGKTDLRRIHFPIPTACRMQMDNKLVNAAKRSLVDNVNRESPEKKLDDFLDRSLGIKDVIFQQQYILEDENNKFREVFRFFTSRESLWTSLTLLLTAYINIVMLIDVKGSNDRSFFYLHPSDLRSIREAGGVHLFMSCILMFNYLLGTALVNITSGFKWKQNVQDGLIPLSFLGSSGDTIFEIACAILPNFGWTILFLITDFTTFYYLIFIVFSFLGLVVHPGFFCFHVLDVCQRIPLLGYVIKSVTMNIDQVLVTFLLGTVLMWIYSVIGVYCFGYNTYSYGDSPDSYTWPETLASNFWQHLDFGLRGPPIFSQYTGELSTGKYIFDISYQIFIIVIMVAIITGIIIDTFSDLRAARADIESDQANVCFICSIGREVFERNRIKFSEHLEQQHNPWHYLYYQIYLQQKSVDELTGLERNLLSLISKQSIEYFPLNKALCLPQSEQDEEISDKIDKVQNEVARLEGTLTSQINNVTQKVNLISSSIVELLAGINLLLSSKEKK